MNERGTITIETCNKTVHEPADNQGVNDLEPGNYVMLAISDTGNGIPQDQINRLVEPFYTTKPAGQGSGLGLSMVHGFMKQSSGSVHVYSEVGVGTTVKLFFPAFSEEPTSMPIPIPERPELDQPSIRILVAEDQPEVMNVVVRILQKAGHNVVEAATGDIALELFHSNGPFDLLLTDIVMPGRLQGPDLARELRALDPSLPVAFMTGYAREATLHGNGLREEDIRLMKPVSRSDLLDAVKTAVGSTT